jgi:AcrR family transcriptional regulator
MSSKAAETKESLVEEFRKDTILRAARHVIARRGLAGASMQAIADEAGVAKGTLYLYFRDRDELVDHTGSGIFEELLARVRIALDGERPLREGLRELVRTILEFFDANQELLRVLVATREPDEAACHRRRRRPQYEQYLALLSRHFAGAVGRGEMKPLDTARVALFFAEGMRGILKQRLEERNRKAAEDVEWIVEMMVSGVAARKRA